MAPRDLPRVLEIERESFRMAWDEGRFLDALNTKSGCWCVAVESEQELVGYFIIEVHARSVHIVNLAVHPRVRRRGLASRCLALIHQIALRSFGIARSRDEAALEPLAAPARQHDRKKGKAIAARPSGPAVRISPDTLAVEASTEGAEGEIHLEVEESNLPAQLLYRKMGYRAVEILRNYYSAYGEDGYKMVRRVPIADAVDPEDSAAE